MSKPLIFLGRSVGWDGTVGVSGWWVTGIKGKPPCRERGRGMGDDVIKMVTDEDGYKANSFLTFWTVYVDTSHNFAALLTLVPLLSSLITPEYSFASVSRLLPVPFGLPNPSCPCLAI